MNIAVIGAQWGDEGKGKIVDFLASEGDLIVRFSGGANAGHTIVHGEKVYKLHLVPSGVVYPDKEVALGSGMVIDPAALFSELGSLEEAGVSWRGRVFISDRAHVVVPRYREMDKSMDEKRILPIGTTGRGIGVAYAQKASRDGVRVADLFDPKMYSRLPQADRDYLDPFLEDLEQMSGDLVTFMHNRRGRRILLEGAQGVLLDLDLGTYPFVSSGMSAAAGASLGAGIGPRELDGVMGVFKAYSTRVGNGPFPTEFPEATHNGLTELVRELGNEYGVTTGRPRRCGYLDLVALRYACLSNAFDALTLTHLDVYDSLEEIQACTGYRIGGKTVNTFPARLTDLEEAEPVLETFPGWKTPITNIKRWEDLPKNARDYVEAIEGYVETPVDIISVGSDREHTILRKNPWTRFSS